MKGQTAQNWRMLCELAVVEKDPDKLLQLVKEINRLISEKENRLRLPAVDAAVGRARIPVGERRR